MTKVLGINPGHHASVALSIDGRVVFAINEERLRQQKAFCGIPRMALDHCYENYLARAEVDCFALNYRSSSGLLDLWQTMDSCESEGGPPRRLGAKDLAIRLVREVGGLTPPESLRKRLEYPLSRTMDLLRTYCARKLDVPWQKLALFDHHLCHARSASFSLSSERDWLVFTADGEGDLECATVYRKARGEPGLSKLTAIHRDHSLGFFFMLITKVLGMSPNLHEYKVMGLEPYARKNTNEYQRAFAKLSSLFYFEGRDFRARIKMHSKQHLAWLYRELRDERFDYVAAAAQKTLERVVLRWVGNWIRETGICNVAVAGGVFMNVKLNQRLYDLQDITDIYVVPSAGDETTVLGACNQANLDATGNELVPLEHLYLGNECAEVRVREFVEKEVDQRRYDVRHLGDRIEERVAELLSEGTIVGRFAGRMEFGARALGNRSILAHPKHPGNVRKLNEMIKDRDFWMPFTPSVLEEDADRYIKNPRRMLAPYMAITFDTTDEGKAQFIAAIHPYDETMRIQMVSREKNPRYHELIRHFKERTGVGGLLNTSFNLHGRPIVCAPADCLFTLENSGLTHIALDGYLVTKRL